MASRIPKWLFTVLLLASAANADDRFHARFSDDLATVHAELCFDGAAPNRLYRHSRAGDYASGLLHEGSPLKVRGRRGSLRLPALPDDACLTWRMHLDRAARDSNWRTAFALDDAVVAVTTLWFWKGPWQRPVVATVDLPEGTVFSTPWPRDPVDPTRYRPVPTPSGWSSKSAVGRFELRTLEPRGGRVRLALLGDLDTGTKDRLARWIATTVDAVVPVFGHFPRENVQVLIVPIGPRGEPVPWAQVQRGGGPSIQFFVDQTRPLSEFDADWTATHEFSHLFLPYVSRDDRWLSEGLASYYQNVLRVRDGRLTGRQGWQELDEGFRRGQRATGRGTLEEAMEAGWRSTRRVYWSGAAMMLQADTALRARTGGRQTLDTALARFMTCCFEDGRRWSALEVLETLDRITGTDVFTTVRAENLHRPAFPDLEPIYEALGLDRRGERVVLRDEAPLAGVREDIMPAGPGESRPVPAAGSAR